MLSKNKKERKKITTFKKKPYYKLTASNIVPYMISSFIFHSRTILLSSLVMNLTNYSTETFLTKITNNLFVNKQFIGPYLIWLSCCLFTLSTNLFFFKQTLLLTSVGIPAGVGGGTSPNKTSINVNGILLLLSFHLSGSSFNSLDSSTIAQPLNIHVPKISYSLSLGNLIYLP